MRLRLITVLLVALAGFGLSLLVTGCGDEPHAQQGQSSIEDALEAVFHLPSGVGRTTDYLKILGDLNDERAETIATVFERDLRRPAQHEVRLFTGAWAEFEPQAAFERALGWNERTARVAGAREAIEVWARNRPVEARLALSDLGHEMKDIRGTLSIALVIGWVQSGVDPEGLGPHVSQLEGRDRERATRELIHGLVTYRGDDAAMAWVDSLPEDVDYSFRNLAYRKISLVIGRDKPELVARWLDPRREHRYGQAGFRILGRTWASVDPQAAMDWVATTDQPDDRARFLFINFAFDYWQRDDPEAAEAWLASMPDDGLADPAHLAFALSKQTTDPVRAVQSALRIRLSDLRLDTFQKVLTSWSKRTPMEATDWLKENGLAQPEQALAERVMAGAKPPQEGSGGLGQAP